MLEIHDFNFELMNPLYISRDIEVPVIDNNLNYSDFFELYLIKNKPCLVNNVTEKWPCTKNWIIDKAINFNYFSENLQNIEVPVSNCGKREYNVQKKCTMKLRDYVHYLQSCKTSSAHDDCLYLKDWHFVRDFPEENTYRVPAYFASDWLNEFYDGNPDLHDDYRFVYIGPKNSWTPFHADVFTSYSWSTNICGRKKWILVPPGKEKYLTDELGNLKYDITREDIKEAEFPILEVVQEEGQAIFVPSGWHHQVWNLEETISINHNWINGCNINHVWNSMKKTLLEVKKEISDCQDTEDWPSQCQIILASTFGFNFETFHSFLTYIAKVRIKALKKMGTFSVFGNWKFGENHIKYDLIRVLTVLKLLENDDDFHLELKNDDTLNQSYEYLDNLNDFIR